MNYEHNTNFGLFKFQSGYRKLYLNSPKGCSRKIISAQTDKKSLYDFTLRNNVPQMWRLNHYRPSIIINYDGKRPSTLNVQSKRCFVFALIMIVKFLWSFCHCKYCISQTKKHLLYRWLLPLTVINIKKNKMVFLYICLELMINNTLKCMSTDIGRLNLSAA